MSIKPEDIRDALDKARGFSEVQAADVAIAEELISTLDSLTIKPELAEDARPAGLPAAQPAVGTDDGSTNIRNQIAEMTMPEKIKLALLGNSVCRGLLILDTNRMIQQFVLKNPKLGITEVETFARNPQMAEGVLRTIADSKQWMKNSTLKYAIVTNPKTPGDLALRWMRYLNAADLRKISKSKNLPQLIAVTAKKRLADLEEK
ncbi:MAG: hypothetical protein J0M12_15455 [Deltaproteobacteria bacterium]|nr:hypothetical protein [Deltaproteobacteria bacterium]